MSLPKRNSADGRCHWMKPEVQEELQPLFDQCIQDAPESGGSSFRGTERTVFGNFSIECQEDSDE